MPALIGIALAAFVAALGRIAGLDRDRAFYAVILIVVASYYVLFAVMAGAHSELPAEIAIFALFAAAAVIGFRASPWIIAAGLAGHGLFDIVRASFLTGSGVPAWWPQFCLAYDVAAGAGLAAILLFGRTRPAGSA